MSKVTQMEDADSNAAAPTELTASETASQSLPPGLAARFRVERKLSSHAEEAEVLLVQALAEPIPLVLKLYRPGIQPNTDVLQRITQVAPTHIIKLHEHGAVDGAYYEIQEYAAHGSLRELMRGPMPPAQVQVILEELVPALGYLQAQDIIHRNLKPEHILVRNLWPLDLALTDFAMASVSGLKQHSGLSHNMRYSAPETMNGMLSAKADWWSLGMILLELLTGKHPFANLADVAILNWLQTRSVLVEISDPAWNTLCRGLLVRDPNQRWAGSEIIRWQQGENVAVVAEVLAAPSNAQAVQYRTYRIGEISCTTPEQLARALTENWQEGIKHLARGLIFTWLRDELKDQVLISFVMDLAEEELTENVKLLKLIRKLAPHLPPVYKDITLSEDNLQALAKQAMQKEAKAQALFWEIYSLDILANFPKHPQLYEVRRIWQQGIQEYQAGWQKIIDAGASAQLQPELAVILPRVFFCLFSPVYAESLRKYVAVVAATLPKHAQWYLSLGESHAVPAACLPILTVLNTVVNQKPEDNARYIDNGNGTIIDNQTGLQWMKFALGQHLHNSYARDTVENFTWDGAILAAEQLNARRGYAGFEDWRVPDITELKSLLLNDPDLMLQAVINSSKAVQNFWSASLFPHNTTGAWYLDFLAGRENFGFRTNRYALRLVRNVPK